MPTIPVVQQFWWLGKNQKARLTPLRCSHSQMKRTRNVCVNTGLYTHTHTHTLGGERSQDSILFCSHDSTEKHRWDSKDGRDVCFTVGIKKPLKDLLRWIEQQWYIKDREAFKELRKCRSVKETNTWERKSLAKNLWISFAILI